VSCSTLERARMEATLKWRERSFEMPFFEVPQGYSISVTPPFSGADARFRVRRPDGEETSIYCDFYGNLGSWRSLNNPEPYWEVYPYAGDVGRCDVSDTETLWKMIKGEAIE
jgi:hypothetical protein